MSVTLCMGIDSFIQIELNGKLNLVLVLSRSKGCGGLPVKPAATVLIILNLTRSDYKAFKTSNCCRTPLGNSDNHTRL